MTPNEYQREAMRTAQPVGQAIPRESLLINGVLGLTGEAGECADLVKKHFFQGHMLDRQHLASELGDVAWYLAVAARSIGYDLETILIMNVNKLQKRYPDGFDPIKSMNREEGDI